MAKQPLPIFSSREDVPELQDDINRFVIGLAEYIDSLQDAENDADLDQVERLCANLAMRSSQLGYQLIAETAEQISDACREGKNEVVSESLLELTKLAQRVRLGHRGAA
jgi:HPt (histidine-containing phosphotransfer) domain-containing protein